MNQINDINELQEDEIKFRASQLALSMYERMCTELHTALVNIENIRERQMCGCLTGSDVAYMHGAKDAFREIADRIIKEKNLASKPSDFEIERSMEMMYREQIDKEFPQDKIRGRGRSFFEKFCKLTRKVSSLICKNFHNGFYLGQMYERMNSLKDKEELTADDIRKKFINEYIPYIKQVKCYGHGEDDMTKVWSEDDWEEIINGTF